MISRVPNSVLTNWLPSFIANLVFSRDAYIQFEMSGGTRFFLSVETQNPDPYHAAVAGSYVFDDTWRLILKLIRPDDVFFDVGANIGTISIPAAVVGAKVYAFELLETNIIHLSRSICRNKLRNITTIHCAVADADEPVGTAGHSAWGVVSPDETGTIKGITLDNYVVSNDIGRVDLIKIDIEGSEMRALKGMSSLLRRDRPDVVIECNAATCQHFDHSIRDLLKFLREFQYDLYRIHADRLCPWNVGQVQELICADYYVTVKPANQIKSLCGWEILSLSEAEVVENVEKQDSCGDLHKQYILAIADHLPTSERINFLIKRWSGLQDPRMLKMLRRGAL